MKNNVLLKRMQEMAAAEGLELSETGVELVKVVEDMIEESFLAGYEKGQAGTMKATSEYAKTGREEME